MHILTDQKVKRYSIAIISALVALLLSGLTAPVWSASIPGALYGYSFASTAFIYYFCIQFALKNGSRYYMSHAQPWMYAEQPLTFTPQNEQALKQWHMHLISYLRQEHVLKQPTIFIYDWRSKKYVTVFTETVTAFPENHAVVFGVRQQEHGVMEAAAIKQLPEVIALDIQYLLKQYQADTVVPLGMSGQYICGFIFGRRGKILKEISEQHIEVLRRRYGEILQKILQHEAIISTTAKTELVQANKQKLLSWPVGITILGFILLTIWWLVTSLIENFYAQRFLLDFSNIYGVMAIWGGVWGFIAAWKWREQKNISWALRMFACGLFLQEFGQISYGFYDMRWNITIPYPSIGDIGYFGSIPFYIAGVILLARACGVTLRLKSWRNSMLVVLLPAVVVLSGYLLFLQDYIFDWNQPIRIFLDFGYPLTEAIYVSLALLTYLLTRDSGGKMKRQVLMIVYALIWQFMCDYVFLYQAYHGTWAPNGVNDYMYLLSYFGMGMAILSLRFTNPKSS